MNQILNFGLPAPIDVQISGQRFYQNYAIAQKMRQEIAGVPGATDVHINQIVYAPELHVNVDRSRAQTIGLSEANVANSMLYALAGSGQATPNYWLNPQNGVNYLVVVQTPQYQMDSLTALTSIPITSGSGVTGDPNAPAPGPQLLNNLARVDRESSPSVTNHYNVQPVFDIFSGANGRDLGGVGRDIDKIIDKYRKLVPPGTQITMRGQVLSMRQSFTGLGLGMIFAVLLVYLLMVVNFQSWLDPFIILTALPGAACGILWMLFLPALPLASHR